MTYQGVTPQVFNAMKARLEGMGFTLPGTHGTLSGPFGIRVNYEWDESANTLYTEVAGKNFFVSCNDINNRLSQALKEAGMA